MSTDTSGADNAAKPNLADEFARIAKAATDAHKTTRAFQEYNRAVSVTGAWALDNRSELERALRIAEAVDDPGIVARLDAAFGDAMAPDWTRGYIAAHVLLGSNKFRRSPAAAAQPNTQEEKNG